MSILPPSNFYSFVNVDPSLGLTGAALPPETPVPMLNQKGVFSKNTYSLTTFGNLINGKGQYTPYVLAAIKINGLWSYYDAQELVYCRECHPASFPRDPATNAEAVVQYFKIENTQARQFSPCELPEWWGRSWACDKTDAWYQAAEQAAEQAHKAAEKANQAEDKFRTAQERADRTAGEKKSEGVRKLIHQGIMKELEEAVALGSGGAAHMLSIWYREGRVGVNKDVKTSFECLQKAADLGFFQAQFELAEHYFKGTELPGAPSLPPVDRHAKALALLEKALAKGRKTNPCENTCWVNATILLGKLYLSNFQGQQQFEKALECFWEVESSVPCGQSEWITAKFLIGYTCLCNPMTVPQAMTYTTSAAEYATPEHPDWTGIQYQLGLCHQRCLPATSFSQEEAVACFGEVLYGNAPNQNTELWKGLAHFKMGLRFHGNKDTQIEALQHFLNAAKWEPGAADKSLDRWNQNHLWIASAQTFVGLAFYNGLGVESDDDLAYRYFLKGSKGGYSMATHLLGICQLKKRGCKGSDRLAGQFFQKAIAQGCTQSYYWLAAICSFANEAEFPRTDIKKYLEAALQLNPDDAASHFLLARCFREGVEGSIPRNLREAYKEFANARQLGSLAARLQMAEMIFQALGSDRIGCELRACGVPPDAHLGFALINDIVENDDKESEDYVEALLLQASCCELGMGTTKNLQRARDCLVEASTLTDLTPLQTYTLGKLNRELALEA